MEGRGAWPQKSRKNSQIRFPTNKSPCEHEEGTEELIAVIKLCISCQPAAHTGKRCVLRELLCSSSQLGQDLLITTSSSHPGLHFGTGVLQQFWKHLSIAAAFHSCLSFANRSSKWPRCSCAWLWLTMPHCPAQDCLDPDRICAGNPGRSKRAWR